MLLGLSLALNQGPQWLGTMEFTAQYSTATWFITHFCPGLPGLAVPPSAVHLWGTISAVSLGWLVGRRIWTYISLPMTHSPDWLVLIHTLVPDWFVVGDWLVAIQ